jgi:ADP-ribose pyrophosphatase
LNDEVAYNGWLKIIVRHIGNRSYDILKDHDAVAAIITNHANEILLVKQFRPALMKETLEIPAGTIDNLYENKIDCVIRELKEETGLEIPQDLIRPVLLYQPNVGFSDRTMNLFHVQLNTAEHGSYVIRDEDVSEIIWLKITDLAKMIDSGEILDVKTIIAYLYLNQNTRKI